MRLVKREKLIVLGGAGLLALLLALQFAVRPFMERTSTLRRVVVEKREVLAQLQAKAQEYERLQADVSQLRSSLGRQEESRKILSTIERLRQAAKLPEDALSMKPTTTAIDKEYQETVIEVVLDSVTLAQLIAFLSQLDSPDLLGGIKALDVGRADRNPEALRATIELATVARVERM
jgi:type II secretory pathway component PulM